MDAVVTALTGVSGITADSFFGVFTDLVPFLVILVPTAFAIGKLAKIIKGASKGKVRI